MLAWFLDALANVTLQEVLIGAGLFVATFVGSLIVVAIILVRIPPTFFLDHHSRDWWGNGAPWLRWLAIIGKNLLGVLLVVLGGALSLPGVPGQGILTILIGIVLLDFPGKRQVERKIVGRPKVLAAINRLRARYGRPPLELEDPPAEPPRPAARVGR